MPVLKYKCFNLFHIIIMYFHYIFSYQVILILPKWRLIQLHLLSQVNNLVYIFGIHCVYKYKYELIKQL